MPLTHENPLGSPEAARSRRVFLCTAEVTEEGIVSPPVEAIIKFSESALSEVRQNSFI